MSAPAGRASVGHAAGGAAAARVAELYAEHGQTVLVVCRALLRDPVEAEDAAQQTFLSAQRALVNGSVPREPGAWLATIARNECIGRIRGRMREALPTADEPAGHGPDAHAAALRREQVTHLREALESLPAQQRDAILLREVRGLSYDEVAETLAVSTSAVESLLFRARRGLQVRLREAAAALTTAGWIGPLRDLASRLVGGGVATPVAAKAVAVGLGTAVMAGGAVVVQHEVGAGHATRPTRPHTIAGTGLSSAPAAAGPERRPAAAAPLVFAPSATPAASPVDRARHAASGRPAGGRESGDGGTAAPAAPEDGTGAAAGVDVSRVTATHDGSRETEAHDPAPPASPAAQEPTTTGEDSTSSPQPQSGEDGYGSTESGGSSGDSGGADSATAGGD